MIILKLNKKEYSFDDIQKMNEDELADFLDIYAEYFYDKGYNEGYRTANLKHKLDRIHENDNLIEKDCR